MASFSFLHKSFITFLHYTFNHSNLHRGNLSVITYHQCSNFHRTQFSQISQNTSLPRTKTSTNSNLKPFIVGVPNNPTERSIFQNISARKHWLLYELRNCFVLSLSLSRKEGRRKLWLIKERNDDLPVPEIREIGHYHGFIYCLFFTWNAIYSWNFRKSELCCSGFEIFVKNGFWI